MKNTELLLALLLLPALGVLAQPELEPWGNMNGIRVEGQLMPFTSGLRIVRNDGSVNATGKERQHPLYSRENGLQVVRTVLDSLYFTETVEDAGRGMARVRISWTVHADMDIKAVNFTIAADAGQALTVKAEKGDMSGETRQGQRIIDIELGKGQLQKGQTGEASCLISVGGDIDTRAVTLTLDTDRPGRVFDGLGGNFRIQNTALDPQVIAYCLKNLRLAWGRVELPWRFWQPVKASSPLDSARAGHLHPAVLRALEMAKTLGEKKIPVIVSAWFPPDWAAEGPVRFRPGPDHVWGNPLNKANMEEIYKSIADYVVALKELCHTEVKYFSFNESDIGINVRQTGQEHDELIKGLGAYFASRGLGTRVLLGDNSDANTYRFIDPAMEDAAARSYMGAISFHSWRGWDTATLEKWAAAATRLQLPLLVGEGSIDAAAWNYPAIFLEPSYALKEISLYTLLLSICQPASILQWQLTSDYSPLAGGGIFHDSSALHPTQRFWNLKQLSMTPPGLSAMPLRCEGPDVTVAALGNNDKGVYVLHLVNNGARREAVLRGLPATVKRLRVYTTNSRASVAEGKPVRVSGGEARLVLEQQSYVTVMASR